MLTITLIRNLDKILLFEVLAVKLHPQFKEYLYRSYEMVDCWISAYCI